MHCSTRGGCVWQYRTKCGVRCQHHLYHLYPDDWKKLPIPDVDAKAQAPIVKLVDKILDAKRTDPNADIAALEQEINARVHRLYGLTPEESKIVEGGVP